MRLLKRLAMVLAMLVIAAPAAAQTFPKFTGLVVDAANVIPPDVEAALTAKLAALQKDTHRQLIVATIPDLQGYPLEDYGYRLGRSWGVGLRDVNNGIILFIAPNEPKGHRGPRIEVGYGLEPIITDALSHQIIFDAMIPRLKATPEDIPGALTAGTDALIAQLRASPDEAKARTDAAVAEFDKANKRKTGNSGGFPFGFAIWVMIVGFVILSSLRGGKRGKRYRSGHAPVILWGPGIGSGWGSGGGSSWGSGGGSSFGGGSDSDGGWGGGGFSGGGGGSFGGGGASGDW